MALFVTGTGTDVGKTVFSALLMARYGGQLNLRYLKPVQTGTDSDRDTVQKLSALGDAYFLPGYYHFKLAASPHLAAEKESMRLDVVDLVARLRKYKEQKTVIELAGGLMVPLTRKGYFTNLDLLREVGFPAVLVAATGLGTINHTVLSWQALQSAGIDCAGIVFVGKKDILREDNMQTIAAMTGAAVLGDFILPSEPLTPDAVFNAVESFDSSERIRELLS